MNIKAKWITSPVDAGVAAVTFCRDFSIGIYIVTIFLDKLQKMFHIFCAL